MTRTVVIFGFLAAFVAGFILGGSRGNGWLTRPAAEPATQPAEAPPAGRPDSGSYLAQQLGLTDEQQQKMREIWSEVAGRRGRQMGEQRRQLRQQRDAQIAALVRPEDRGAYDAAVREYEAKLAALEAESRQAFAGAVEKTKALLNEQQREKYEQILRQWDTRERDRHRGGRTPRSNPTSRPDQP